MTAGEFDLRRAVRGPLLNPRPDGRVDYIADAILSGDTRGRIEYVGPAPGYAAAASVRRSRGIILPPLIDAHIHIPQFPIRGRFVEGIAPGDPQGRLLAGLNRNVFPAEARCQSEDYARQVVRDFLRGTIAQGVVGGAAYMTIHPAATRIALEELPPAWSVGLVLMDMNCPPYLRTSTERLDEQIRELAARFGRRVIVTDRFAVSVSTPLRRRMAALAADLGLRMQTHLNEQPSEKRFVEQVLYTDYDSYTDVYRRDGLLARDPILAHCVRMDDREFDTIAEEPCAVAHCPTSNTLLGSGVMPLDKIVSRAIPWAICTDVGASPTTSLLAEAAQFLKVHQRSSARATPSAALCAITAQPAAIVGIESGSFAVGNPMSFIEVAVGELRAGASADEAIQLGLFRLNEPALRQYREGDNAAAMDRLREVGLDDGPDLGLLESDTRKTAALLESVVQSVTLRGKEVFRREFG